MEERLEAILIWLEESVKATGEFVAEQAPEVVREVITFHRVFGTSMVALGLVLFGVAVFRLKRNGTRWAKDATKFDNEGADFMGVANILLSVVFSIAGTIIFAFNVNPTMKVWFAPRLFLIEWVGRAF